MPSRKITDCVPSLQYAFEYATTEWEKKYSCLPKPFLTCTHRSYDEQAELYAIGRTKPGRKVTNAKPGTSKHNINPSKAFDIAFVSLNKKLDWSPDLFKKFADIIKEKYKNEIVWGGDFKTISDAPHFETKL